MTPDGQRVVSASDDQTLKVWDLVSGRAEATPPPRGPTRSAQKHTILFLAANPTETAQLALDREARAIHKEIGGSGIVLAEDAPAARAQLSSARGGTDRRGPRRGSGP